MAPFWLSEIDGKQALQISMGIILVGILPVQGLSDLVAIAMMELFN